MARLGLTVNWGKSCLDPSQRVTYLGMVLDSVAMRACLSPRRVNDILCLLPIFRAGRRLLFVQFLQLLGKLTAASAVVPLGLLSLWPLQMWMNSLHLDAKWHRQRRVRVTLQCLVSLSPWRERAYLAAGMPMGAIPARRELVTTDASLSGWGAVWRGRTAQGRWSAQEGTQKLALACFLPHLAGRHVLVRSDNMSTVSQGGTRSARLLRVSRSLLTWASPRLASLRAVYLPGDRNPVADFLSRRKPPPGEWQLHPEVVDSMWGLFGKAEVDLFASEESMHCPPLVLLDRSNQPVGAGRVGARLAGQTSACLSTIASDPTDTPEGPFAGPPASAGGSLLAREALVSTAAQTLLQCAMAPPRQEGPPVTTEGSDLASRPLSPPALGLATAGPDPLLRDCTAAVRGTVLTARAPSTRLQYENRWKLDPVHCTVATVLEFLQLESGRSHSTLKVYVAAISSLHDGVDGAMVGRHRLVSLFLRGALRLCPPTAMRAPAWDLPLVLEALSSPPFEPLGQVRLKWLSMKAAFLHAITSAKRVGELHALSVSDTCLRWNSDGSGVTLWPNVAFLPKVLPRNHLNQPIQLARFDPHLRRVGMSCCARCGL